MKPETDKSVFVFGHYGKRLETLDKERFKLLAQANPQISLFRHYNSQLSIFIREIEDIKSEKINDDLKISKINIILNKIEKENYLHIIFEQANKLMLGLGDSVSFGSLVAGEFTSKVKHGKIVKPKEKVIIE